MKTVIQHHPYRDDGTADVNGKGRCVECGTPASNKRHELPDNEAAEVESRRLGEREEER